MAVIGYREIETVVDGSIDYQQRSYTFAPIQDGQRGFITTAAFLLCSSCNTAISSSGGPGYRSYCPSCYELLKLQDFAEGHQHVTWKP